MKQALFVIALIALAQFVTAAVYQQNATNIYIYEDFDDFNQSRWFNYTSSVQQNVFRVEGGQLIYQCDYVNTTGLFDALFLTDSDFIMNPKDEWTITFNVSTGGTSNAERMYVSFNSNTTLEPWDYNLAQEYYYVTLTGASTPELHAMQGIDLHERYNVLNGGGRMTTSQREYSFVKRNIPENNTWYIEAYEEGMLIYNDSSVFHGSAGACGTEPFCPRTTDNFTYSEFYLGFGGWSATTDQDWVMDYFELSVDRAQLCVPDWQCSGYDTCNTSNQAPCNAVTDMNACGDTYSGDYSEFSAQTCDYCAFSVTHPVTGDTSTCEVYGYPNNTALLTNFATCCNVTKLASDCLCDNGTVSLDYRLGTNYAYCVFGFDEADIVSETWYLTGSCGGYQSQYTSADIAPAAIDGLTIFVITIVGLAGLIAIYIGASFAYRTWRRK
jgi:hypothetical protein